MTIKLSNKHHPAMFPNADCGRARRVRAGRVALFPVTLMQNLKHSKEKKSKVCHERRRGKGGEREREEGVVQNMLALFAYVLPPLFH